MSVIEKSIEVDVPKRTAYGASLKDPRNEHHNKKGHQPHERD
jgi:hypothetical protein